jgi:Lar family restriction alleviation protein
MSETLRLCPFCGGKARVRVIQGFVRCDTCNADGPWGVTRKEAIAAWNARPGDAARETTITEAIQALIDAGDYFSARADVNDGDYGVPSPNREMTLASQCDEALERLEALRARAEGSAE